MKRFIFLTSMAILSASLSLITPVLAGDTPSVEGAKAYIVNIKGGDVVSNPVTVIFGLSGMGVAPASVDKAKTGHHHLFINRAPFGEGELGSEEADLPIPNTEHTRHFGGGQTQVTLELPTGKNTLQLVLADYLHVPHDKPVVSDYVTFTVK